MLLTIITRLCLRSQNLPLHPAPRPPAPGTPHSTLFLQVQLFTVLLCIRDITQYFSFSLWLISLRIMPPKPTHVVTDGRIPFFSWLNNIALCIYITPLVPIHPLVDTCLALLALANNVAIHKGFRYIFCSLFHSQWMYTQKLLDHMVVVLKALHIF